MIILGYVGNHAQDSLAVRLGWAATRLVQRGQFARVTHVEGYYGANDEGQAIIASASLRDGGWTLSALCTKIIANSDEWGFAVGNILGQKKARFVQLEAKKAECEAGTCSCADILALDLSISSPEIDLEEKF